MKECKLCKGLTPNAETIASLESTDIEHVGTVDDLRHKYAHLSEELIEKMERGR